jgi:hypothetical protein
MLPKANKRNAKQIEVIKAVLSRAGETALCMSFVDNTLHVVTFYNRNDKPCLVWWWNDAKGMNGNYYYMNNEARDKKLGELIELAESRSAHKKEQAEKRKNNRIEAEVGDIFYASWGYDQTNVDLYQVVERKGKATVKMQPIASTWVDYEYGKVKADPTRKTGDEFTARLGQYGVKVGYNQTARRTSAESTHYCTLPGMGH